jgi:predicted dehydrogenase
MHARNADGKVRYAVVGLGDIAQESMMPGVEHTGNSVVTTLITGDAEKAKKLGEKYDVAGRFHYDEFAEAIASKTFDAIYLATPNWRHEEFIVPALKAGIHVLTEKPLEVSTAQCRKILDAEKMSSAKLMVAYRLHFEAATLDTIARIRSGEFGEVYLFNSTFTQMVNPKNHRAHSGEAAGPVMDMAPYSVNAARYVFGDEPIEVLSAVGTKHPESGYEQNFADTVAVTLLFPGGKLAQFSVSYFGNLTNSFIAVGTKGSVQLDPAYIYDKALEQVTMVGDKIRRHTFKHTDHFGGELKYFSDCILKDVHPEPDGEEGFADVRVLEGILSALKSGEATKLVPFKRTRRIDTDSQKIELSAVKKPELVHASNPTRGTN